MTSLALLAKSSPAGVSLAACQQKGEATSPSQRGTANSAVNAASASPTGQVSREAFATRAGISLPSEVMHPPRPLPVALAQPAQLVTPSRNSVLAKLRSEDFAAIEPFLRLTDLGANELVCRPDHPSDRVVFPVDGAIASQIAMRDGKMATGWCVGREGVVGAGSAFSARPVRFPMIVVLPGKAWQIGSAQLREVAMQRPTLRQTILLALDDALDQAELSAVCGQLHDATQRLASALLINRRRCSSSTLQLTQEALASSLGVQRTSVTAIARSLKDMGAIRYRRGKLQILNLHVLEGAACECHRTHPLFEPFDDEEAGPRPSSAYRA